MSKNALSPEFDLLERDAELAAVEALISTTRTSAGSSPLKGHPG
jgi:hypothetical protein